MSLELYCLLGSTVEFFYIKKNIKEIEVLMSLEFFCFWTSSVFGVLLSASHVQNAQKKFWALIFGSIPPHVLWIFL